MITKIWKYISYLGLYPEYRSLESRNNILTNRINFVIVLLLIALVIATAIIREVIGGSYTLHTKKILILLILCLPNFIFAYLKKHRLIKIILTFVPSLILVFLPVFFGVIQQFDFMTAPLIVIGASLIPQLILRPEIRNPFYSIAFFYFLLIAITLDDALIYFSHENFNVVETTLKFQVYYKITFVGVMLFIYSIIYYLRNLTNRYESELIDYNEEIKTTLEELKKTQQQLIHSEKMLSLGTLSSGVAHEINNPLNFIDGGLQIIADLEDTIKSKLSEDLMENWNNAIKIIHSGLDRVTNIIKALSAFSDRNTLELSYTNIHIIIDNSLLFLNSKLYKDIVIEKKYQLMEEVPVFKHKIQQVLLNILDNAIFAVKESKFDDKKIIIETKRIDKNCIINIWNNGPQLSTKDLKLLFDPFYTTKLQGKGSGLGLAISYGIIAEHNGKITVKNDNGGVLFTIQIPCL